MVLVVAVVGGSALRARDAGCGVAVVRVVSLAACVALTSCACVFVLRVWLLLCVVDVVVEAMNVMCVSLRVIVAGCVRLLLLALLAEEVLPE